MKAWEANVRKVVPYVPGEQPKDKDVIKLNTNENPYPPSPMVKEAIQKLDVEQFRKYPDPAITDLVSELALAYGVEPENVFVGVGSDDVLAMAFMTFFNSKKPVLFPDITYSDCKRRLHEGKWRNHFSESQCPYRCITGFRNCGRDYFQK